eukprot:6208936-Pleurochrysis_carterae.AAC.2
MYLAGYLPPRRRPRRIRRLDAMPSAAAGRAWGDVPSHRRADSGVLTATAATSTPYQQRSSGRRTSAFG